jgi:hypothetical protein
VRRTSSPRRAWSTRPGGNTFKVHLGGSNLMPFFKGEVPAYPRQEFLYWNDDGQSTGVRVQHLKIVFLEQQHKGVDVWRGEFTSLRVPKAVFVEQGYCSREFTQTHHLT